MQSPLHRAPFSKHKKVHKSFFPPTCCHGQNVFSSSPKYMRANTHTHTMHTWNLSGPLSFHSLWIERCRGKWIFFCVGLCWTKTKFRFMNSFLPAHVEVKSYFQYRHLNVYHHHYLLSEWNRKKEKKRKGRQTKFAQFTAHTHTHFQQSSMKHVIDDRETICYKHLVLSTDLVEIFFLKKFCCRLL